MGCRGRTGENDAGGQARRAIAIAIAVVGCAAPPHSPTSAPDTDEDEVWLYRDRAVIRQRVVIVAPRPGPTEVEVPVAAGVGIADLVVLDAQGADTHLTRALPVRPPRAPVEDPVDDPAGEGDAPRVRALASDPALAATAAVVALTLDAPRAGTFVVALGYPTPRLSWDADYKVTTGPAHDVAVVHGVVAIRNATGVTLRARVHVVDGELGAWRERARELLRRALGGDAIPGVAARALGVLALPRGETRVVVLPDARRALRSVLVFDAIGPELDHPGATPVADPQLGVAGRATTRIAESLEVARDPASDAGLPGGAAQVLERAAGGAPVVLGTGRMFDAATRVARGDTIAIGTARGLTGKRERRDWAKDDDRRRFSEEFLLTIDSARAAPVDVVIREHLYRGQNWTLAYQSGPARKEGAQQIALSVAVPANGQAKVLYVVVYTW